MAIKKGPDFEIVRFSDEQYEKITTEIRYKDYSIAQLNADKSEIEIELLPLQDGVKFDLSQFQDVVSAAAQLLRESV